MRNFLRQFMLYSRAERRAVAALVVLIALVIILPKCYHLYISQTQKPMLDKTLNNDIAEFKNDGIKKENLPAEELSSTEKGNDSGAVQKIHGELFYFDPNIIGIAQWQRLGLSEKQAAVIENYKSKGGQFRQPEDLRRIYVMSDAMKDRLVPYVRIVDAGVDGKARKEMRDKGITFYSIDINKADSAAFEALRGIGPVLSARIVTYREKLGGFVSVAQIGEVHGIKDSVFDAIKPHLTVSNVALRKININKADFETLKAHPYIHARLAKQIISYRETSGAFENIDQLSHLWSFRDNVIEKVKPYVTVE